MRKGKGCNIGEPPPRLELDFIWWHSPKSKNCVFLMSLIRNIDMPCYVIFCMTQKTFPYAAPLTTNTWLSLFVSCTAGSKILIMINILISSQVYSFEQQNIFSHERWEGSPANCSQTSIFRFIVHEALPKSWNINNQTLNSSISC